MGAWYDEIPSEKLRDWILEQKIWFVATAPLSQKGHVNLSPRARPSFHLVDNKSCWWIDMSGSGSETLAHLSENGRITLMFVAFDGTPNICRLFGTGKFFERGSEEFKKYLPDGDERILPGTRAVIHVDIHKVSTSCGFSVPFFDYAGERLRLDEHYAKLENDDLDEGGIPGKLRDYWNLKNSYSIDGMPSLQKLVTDPSLSIPSPFGVANGTAQSTAKSRLPAKTEEEAGTIRFTRSKLNQLLIGIFGLGVVAGYMVIVLATLYLEIKKEGHAAEAAQARNEL